MPNGGCTYMDMYGKGQFYVPQLGGQPITIHEWKERELERWEQTALAEDRIKK